jgi:hypothetical protein
VNQTFSLPILVGVVFLVVVAWLDPGPHVPYLHGFALGMLVASLMYGLDDYLKSRFGK